MHAVFFLVFAGLQDEKLYVTDVWALIL